MRSNVSPPSCSPSMKKKTDRSAKTSLAAASSQCTAAHSAAARRSASSPRSSSRASATRGPIRSAATRAQPPRVVRRMVLECAALPPGVVGQPPRGVLAQELVDLEAAELQPAHQRLPDEVGERPEVRTSHRCGRFPGEAAAEDREPPEDVALLVGQQAPRVVEHRSHASMSLGDVAGSGREEVEAALDLVGDLREESTGVQAAASSIPSGMPSTRRQIRATCGRTSSVRAKEASAWRARSTKSRDRRRHPGHRCPRPPARRCRGPIRSGCRGARATSPAS